ncbi:MAG: hypothetical protein GXP43_00210 [bacterium]|nr:hypothetical protein [bacterium]
MSDPGIKGIGQQVGEQVRSSAKQAGQQTKSDLGGLLEGLLTGGMSFDQKDSKDEGVEGLGSNPSDDQKQAKKSGSDSNQPDPKAMMEKKQKEAELEARLKQVIARYQRIQADIQAYRKRKAQEEEEQRRLEEEEKEKKRREEEARKNQEVRLPSSPKKGFMAGFLKKLSSGGEQGRLKE